MAVMHNGPGRHAQSQAECVHNSAGTHAQRPAVSMHFPGGVRSEVDLVVVDSISRRGREWGMTQSYIELLTQHKVKLLCVKEQLMIDGEGVTLISNNKKAKCP